MIGNNVDMIIGDEVTEIENLLSEIESWSEEILQRDWQEIEQTGFTERTTIRKHQNSASKRSFDRYLVIEKLREKLLCHG